MKKRISEFERGYLAAISNTIAGHGADTSEWNTFCELGLPLRYVLKSKSLCEYDKENLSKLKGFDPDFTIEEVESGE